MKKNNEQEFSIENLKQESIDNVLSEVYEKAVKKLYSGSTKESFKIDEWRETFNNDWPNFRDYDY